MNIVSKFVEAEGWQEIQENGRNFILAYGEKFPVVHPVLIHLKLYRKASNPETKFMHMKAVHDYLWDSDTWNYWTEERFRAHCEGWNYIGWAGGANIGKSYDAAKIAIIFWLSNPKERGVIIASTTLDSASARVWGYITQLLSDMKVKIKFKYSAEKPPKVLYPVAKENKDTEIKDTIHGIFCVAAKQGGDAEAINTWIGRHPKEALLLMLDEAPDLNPAIKGSFSNLDSSNKPFQCVAIGNSKDPFDLHGAMCTPLVGWDKINCMTMKRWETTQRNGICLFFNCYDSPAIFETDPIKKKKLEVFLPTLELIERKKKDLGEKSVDFWRMVIGFWMGLGSSLQILSKELLQVHNANARVEWSGWHPVRKVAGLDPSFSVGGDRCLLRIAKYGVDVTGHTILDFGGEDMLHNLVIEKSPVPVETQIATQAIKILTRHGVSLDCLCMDANGQGRAISEVIRLLAQSLLYPIKIMSVRTGDGKVNSFDIEPMTPYDLWTAIRPFVLQNQIKGLDDVAVQQFATRKIILHEKTKKPSLEDKHDYKVRMNAVSPALAHSPDEADTVALCVQAAIRKCGLTAGEMKTVAVPMDFGSAKYAAFLQGKVVEMEEEILGASFPSANFSGGFEALVDYKPPFT